ncbi:hypothetical protein ACH41H_14025 [Streptomyces sp. NPDC020800]|uniref:hypothetical protein n=1 Tax=Streptomyces sp. NPDC020800 TaxID=3365092 RepID=UPI0037AC7FBC
MPLRALSLSVFAPCSAEYALIGLLLDVSHDLHVSVATAGQLLSACAIAVTLGGPIVAVLTARIAPKTLTLLLLGVFGVAAITLLVPSHLGGGQKFAVRAELATVTRKQVLWALAITAASQTGWFLLYSYITPLLHDVTGFSSGAAAAMLFVFGLGGFLGNALGGKLADRSLRTAPVAVPTIGFASCGRGHRLPDRRSCRAPCGAGDRRGRQQPGIGTCPVITTTAMSGRRRSADVRPWPRPAPRRVRRKENPCVP